MKFNFEHLDVDDALAIKQENLDRHNEMGIDDIRLVCVKQQFKAYMKEYMDEACGRTSTGHVNL